MDEVFHAWKETERIAKALDAEVVIFQCPASFRPAGENKKNLERFFSSIARKDLHLVWEPRGIWQKEEIKALCEHLGLIHCVDPFKGTPFTEISSTFGSMERVGIVINTLKMISKRYWAG